MADMKITLYFKTQLSDFYASNQILLRTDQRQ